MFEIIPHPKLVNGFNRPLEDIYYPLSTKIDLEAQIINGHVMNEKEKKHCSGVYQEIKDFKTFEGGRAFQKYYPNTFSLYKEETVGTKNATITISNTTSSFFLPELSDEWFVFDFYSSDKIRSFFEKKGFYIQTTIDLYKSAINWLWQVKWYNTDQIAEEEKGLFKFSSGSYWYGDNHEYPTRQEAELDALRFCFWKLEKELSNGNHN